MKIFYTFKKRLHVVVIVLILFVSLFTLVKHKIAKKIKSEEYDRLHLENSGPRNFSLKSNKGFCSKNNLHSTCFLGKHFCHPGFFGNECSTKKAPANPWYSEDCPNLSQDITFAKEMPLEMISLGKKCKNDEKISGISKCAYLCFANPISGVAQVPISYWKITLSNEVNAWKFAEGFDDRGLEHEKAFKKYIDVPKYLGNYIEIGSGPYTQTQFIYKDRNFDKITFLDPAAREYQIYTKNCKYKNGIFFNTKVRIINAGAENLHLDPSFGNYDALMSINVIEHVSDAFLVLSNIYNALKTNGLIIYHDRYFLTPQSGDGILGNGNRFHPIRLTKHVFEHFLTKFKKAYLNIIQNGQDYGSIYFIGRKI